jgi:hypothetical protein
MGRLTSFRSNYKSKDLSTTQLNSCTKAFVNHLVINHDQTAGLVEVRHKPQSTYEIRANKNAIDVYDYFRRFRDTLNFFYVSSFNINPPQARTPHGGMQIASLPQQSHWRSCEYLASRSTRWGTNFLLSSQTRFGTRGHRLRCVVCPSPLPLTASASSTRPTIFMPSVEIRLKRCKTRS